MNVLKAEAVTGTIVVNNLQDFLNIPKSNTSNVVLNTDIDLTGVTFAPLIMESGTTFDENGHTIKNYSSNVAMITTVKKGSTIKNLKIKNFNIVDKKASTVLISATLVGVAEPLAPMDSGIHAINTELEETPPFIVGKTNNFIATPALNEVSLKWDAAENATEYLIKRDNVEIA